MTISVLVCQPDGEQVLEEREVDDTWFSASADAEGEGAAESANESNTAESGEATANAEAI